MTDSESKIEKLKSVILLLLDHVDYTRNACGLTELVGAVLPVDVIDQARSALKE